MQAHAATSRTAIVSLGAAVLAVVLGATSWPASGHDVETSAADDDTPANVETAAFDGWLYANPETGCIEPPPPGLGLPDVVPVEPKPAPDVPDDLGERMDEREEGERVPLDSPGPKVHVEPWPACDEPPSATTADPVP